MNSTHKITTHFTRFLLGAILLISLITSSQAQRFGASLLGGINLAQVQGDQLAGYHKAGINGGLKSITYINRRVNFNVEFLYSERGAREGLFPMEGIQREGIDLRYLEVPVYVELKDWIQEAEDGTVYGKMSIYGGLSYARLISSDLINFDPELQDLFNSDDLSYLLGMRFQWSRHWAVNARYTRSLIKVAPASEIAETNDLIPYHITLGLEFIL